jgi:hypothetical protein
MTAVKLSESDKEFIRSYVAEIEDEEVKKQRRRECAEQYGVSLPTISAVTAWTKIRANRAILDAPAEEIKEEIEDDNADGCHANYDNPTKVLWREKWKKFLAERTHPDERERMKVLCLPGKKCLEIPLYLELGFNPKNIVGVEGGDEMAKMEFHNNAYRYGIVPKLGRLENLLPHDTNVYDVVSLDFTGPLSQTCLDIIRKLPLAPAGNSQFNTKSYFMINLLAKRDTYKGQLCLDFYASFTRPELMAMYDSPGMSLEKFQAIFGYVNELADKAVSGERSYEEAELKEKRNIGLVFMLSSLIAKDRRFKDSVWSSYKINEIPIQLREEIDFNKYAGVTLATLLGGLAFYVNKKLLDILTIASPQIVETVSNYRPFVYGVEQYQYVSPVNNANSPFITEMYQLMTPMADYIKLRYFVRFFVDAIFWQGLNPGKKIYLDIRDKHGHIRKPGGDLHHKDSIGFVTEEGFVIATITFQRILDAMNAFMAHIDKDQSMQILSKGQNSRINLSE